MRYRLLGQSGLEVSELCLGTMMFGRMTDEACSRRIIDRAFDAGINIIDTADVYSSGKSEQIVGEAIARNRDAWILCTKVANPMGSQPNQAGLSRKWIFEACENSLRRLKADHIDIYYLHREDPHASLPMIVSAMGDLVRAGKIRHFGLSNHRGWRVTEICNLCDRMGIDRPVVSQPYYNALNRMPEVEHLPACAYHGLGVIPYSPLARGVLTGKYDPKALPPADSRAGRGDKRMMESEWRPESLEIAQILRQHAEARGMPAGALALNWVLNNRYVTAALVGPRTLAQLEDYLAALDHEFDAEDEALVDRLVAPGHPSTPGYNDPHYEIEGRRPRSTPLRDPDMPRPR